MEVSRQWRSLYDEVPSEGKQMMREGLLSYMHCLGYKPSTAAETVVRASKGTKPPKQVAGHAQCEKEAAALERSVLALERAYMRVSKISECKISVGGGGGGGGESVVATTLKLNPSRDIATVTISHEDAKRLCEQHKPSRRRRASQNKIVL
jgi:hypothetical protein